MFNKNLWLSYRNIFFMQHSPTRHFGFQIEDIVVHMPFEKIWSNMHFLFLKNWGKGEKKSDSMNSVFLKPLPRWILRSHAFFALKTKWLMLRLKALPRHFPNWHLLIEELSGRQITAMCLLSLFHQSSLHRLKPHRGRRGASGNNNVILML